MWTLLYIGAGFVLWLYWSRGRNAVWGAATIGAFIGLIVAVIVLIGGGGFSWSIIAKGVAIGALSAVPGELFAVITRWTDRNDPHGFQE